MGASHQAQEVLDFNMQADVAEHVDALVRTGQARWVPGDTEDEWGLLHVATDSIALVVFVEDEEVEETVALVDLMGEEVAR